MQNRNGARNKAFTGRTKNHNWEAFDALPRDIREAVWYWPTNLVLGGSAHQTRADQKHLREQLAKAKRMQSQSTRATYGADHPQAGITLADLGL